MLSLTWFDPIFQGFALGIVAMVLHECGHLIVARATGIRVKDFGLNWKGAYLVREAGTPVKNLLITVAGPLTNVLLLLCWPLSQKFFLANLCLAFFNFLPLRGSDGERMLLCWSEIMAERSARHGSVLKSSVVTLVSTRRRSRQISPIS